MSTRHSHVESIKINPAHVLSLFLNNFLELVYSIPKMICSGFLYDNLASGLEGSKGYHFYFINYFFCLPFALGYRTFLYKPRSRMHVTGFHDTYSIF